MSKQIDLSQTLSDEDKAYLRQLGRDDVIAAAEAGGEDSSATAGPEQLDGDGLDLEDVPNTGDVNTLDRGETGGAAGPDQTAAPSSSGEYDNLKAEELRDELDRRGLPTSGKKDELRARLYAADAEADGEDDEDNQ